jgi:hypothetical protein
MRITGTLLEVEEYSGTAKGDDGKPFDYSGKRLHVLEGREVVKVKIPKPLLDSHGLAAGDSVDLHVTVSAQSGARGAYLTVTLIGEYEPACTFLAVS